MKLLVDPHLFKGLLEVITHVRGAKRAVPPVGMAKIGPYPAFPTLGLDVPPRIEAIQLVHNLQHGPLHLAVAVAFIASTGAADGVHLIDEEDTRLLSPAPQRIRPTEAKRIGAWTL